MASKAPHTNGNGNGSGHIGEVPARMQHRESEYAEEALRAAQRHLDQVAEIARLTDDVEQWRRRATTNDSEIKQLREHHKSVTASHERQIEKLNVLLEQRTEQLSK